MSPEIFIDTREQRPIKFDRCLRIKLDVGDYTTAKHHDKLHLERKSPGDLYGTLLGGHTRFRKELKRAAASGTRLIMVIECTKAKFIAKEWAGSEHCQVNGVILGKIIATMEKRYKLRFIWCKNRIEMKATILKLLK